MIVANCEACDKSAPLNVVDGRLQVPEGWYTLAIDGLAHSACCHDHAVISRQHLRQKRGANVDFDRCLSNMRRVETWWLEQGKHAFDGAPACIFELREILETIGSKP